MSFFISWNEFSWLWCPNVFYFSSRIYNAFKRWAGPIKLQTCFMLLRNSHFENWVNFLFLWFKTRGGEPISKPICFFDTLFTVEIDCEVFFVFCNGLKFCWVVAYIISNFRRRQQYCPCIFCSHYLAIYVPLFPVQCLWIDLTPIGKQQYWNFPDGVAIMHGSLLALSNFKL